MPEPDIVITLNAILVRRQDNPISLTEWANTAGVTPEVLTAFLPTICSLDWIVTVGEGDNARYYISSAGLDELQRNYDDVGFDH
jgi:hypothetical protein